MDVHISRETWVVIGVALVGFLIVAILVRGIWEQVELLRRIEAAEAELAPLVDHAKRRNEALRAELDHVSSPEYAEEWARVYAGMAAPGEVVLAVSLPEDEVENPEPAVATVVGDEADRVWLRLWRWMVGQD